MSTLSYTPPSLKELRVDLYRVVCASNKTEKIVYSDEEVDF